MLRCFIILLDWFLLIDQFLIWFFLIFFSAFFLITCNYSEFQLFLLWFVIYVNGAYFVSDVVPFYHSLRKPDLEELEEITS